MCGIGGIVALSRSAAPPRRSEVARMAAALDHRGPDAAAVVVDGPVALAHTRLSIIDRSLGAQPMSDPSGRYTITYNGEVFDYVELRAELRALGRTFRTASDTEVVLAAWLEWGDDALRRFDGQFAFAVWDREACTLTLARDRLGVRPLHVCAHAGRVYFASEVKALFAADPTIPRAFDPVGLDQIFTWWSVVAPRTPWLGVEEVAPGCVRTIDLGTGRSEEHPYWSPSFTPSFAGSVDDAADEVRAALERAVRLRMLRADVPVGAYVSGGLDSALVAALAARATPRFHTFSVRFEDAEYDESPHQRSVVERLGTEHHEIVVTRDDIACAFADVVRHVERPVLRTAPVPLFLLSRLVRASGLEVVLTGEGADETFAGYDLFREGKVRRFWARHPESSLRPRLLERLYPYLARSPVAQRAMSRRFFGRDLARALEPGFAHGPRLHTTTALKRLFSTDVRAVLPDDPFGALVASMPELGAWSPLAQDQWIEIRTLLSGYLLAAQGDRVSMAHGVEGRYPFLDTRVFELAASLPDAMKLRVLDEKHVLKRAARDLVPPSILRRPKQPYRAPDALAFARTREGRMLAGDLLSPSAVARAGVFDPIAVSRLHAKCLGAERSSNTDDMALVGVLSTQLLHETFIRKPSAREIEPREVLA